MPRFDISKIISYTLTHSLIYIGIIYCIWFQIEPDNKYTQVFFGIVSFLLVIAIPSSFVTALHKFYLNKNKKDFSRYTTYQTRDINDKLVFLHFQQDILNRVWYSKKIIKPIINGEILKKGFAIFLLISLNYILLFNKEEFFNEHSTVSVIFSLVVLHFGLYCFYIIVKNIIFYSFFLLHPFFYSQKFSEGDEITYHTYQEFILEYKQGKLHNDYGAAFHTNWLSDAEKRYFIKGEEIPFDKKLLDMEMKDKKEYLNKIRNIKSF